MKTPAYEYEDEAQQFLAELACLPLSLRPKGQLYHVERKIAEALGGLTAGKPLDFTYEEDVWNGYKQIGIVIADERMIFSLKCCARFLAQEIECYRTGIEPYTAKRLAQCNLEFGSERFTFECWTFARIAR